MQKYDFTSFFENILSLGNGIIKRLSEFVDHLVGIYLHHLGKLKKDSQKYFQKNI